MGFNWGAAAGNLLQGGAEVYQGYQNIKRSEDIKNDFDEILETEDNPRRKQILKTLQKSVDTSYGGNSKGVAGLGALTALAGTQGDFFKNDQDNTRLLISESNANKRASMNANAISGRSEFAQRANNLRSLTKDLNKAIIENGPDSPEVAAIQAQINGMSDMNSMGPFGAIGGGI